MSKTKEKPLSLKKALEDAQRQVANAPPWLKSIYERNDALDKIKRDKLYNAG